MFESLYYIFTNRKKLDERMFLRSKIEKDTYIEYMLTTGDIPKIKQVYHCFSHIGENYIWAYEIAAIRDDNLQMLLFIEQYLVDTKNHQDDRFEKSVFSIALQYGSINVMRYFYQNFPQCVQWNTNYYSIHDIFMYDKYNLFTISFVDNRIVYTFEDITFSVSLGDLTTTYIMEIYIKKYYEHPEQILNSLPISIKDYIYGKTGIDTPGMETYIYVRLFYSILSHNDEDIKRFPCKVLMVVPIAKLELVLAKATVETYRYMKDMKNNIYVIDTMTRAIKYDNIELVKYILDTNPSLKKSNLYEYYDTIMSEELAKYILGTCKGSLYRTTCSLVFQKGYTSLLSMFSLDTNTICSISGEPDEIFRSYAWLEINVPFWHVDVIKIVCANILQNFSLISWLLKYHGLAFRARLYNLKDKVVRFPEILKMDKYAIEQFMHEYV